MRRTVRPLMALAMLSALSLPAASAGPAAADTVPPAGVALLQNAAGKDSGFVLLQTEGDHIRVTVAASNLTPGFHGIHLHSVGKCDGPDFTSAGGHLAATGQTHGSHSGDFPPLFVTADGTGAETFTTNHLTMDQVFDADGSAVIVHGGADNLANIPTRYSSNAPGAPATGPDATTSATGDSGARVLCGFMSTELVNLRGDNPKPADGTVGGFGEAIPAGDAPAGAKPVVGIAAAVATDGYWLAATDGGVFTGRAPFLGSMGGKTLNAPMVGISGTPTGLGYLMAGADGGIFTFGDAKFEGSTGGIKLNKPVVGVATRSARAYAVLHDATGNTLGTLTLTGTDSAVIAAARAAGLTNGFHGFHFHSTAACTPPGFVDAGGHLSDDGENHGMHDGDMPALLANSDGTAETAFGSDNVTFPELFDADGSSAMIHAGSDNYANIPADRYSSAGNPGPDATTLATGDADGRLACGVVQGVADANGGYWEVASDGGVFAFGNAGFYGSLGDKHLNAPIVGMTPTPSGKGYWLVAADGGVFSFGDAAFFGSLGATHLNAPIVSMTADPTGLGYWLVAKDGGVFTFGTSRFFGSEGATPPPHGAAGLAASLGGHGYWVANT